jgi:chitinase
MVPAITITNPPNSLVATSPTSIPVNASVVDNLDVSVVQYFQGTTSLGLATNSPYSLVWTNVTTGIYSLTASATDSGGMNLISAPVSIIVDTNPATTYRGGDGVSDYIKCLEGRNPLVGTVPDTNNVIQFQIYTPFN